MTYEQARALAAGRGVSLKPILFSTPMVQAILEGRKTMTRRVIKPQPVTDILGMQHWRTVSSGDISQRNSIILDYAPYQPGDILWVRETWRPWLKGWCDYLYKADSTNEDAKEHRWKPSIFMPREAARLFLEVKSARVERLQDISEKDAAAEGTNKHCHCKYHAVKNPPIACMPNETHKIIDCVKCRFYNTTSFKAGFSVLWNSIYAKRGYSWESNPWVWAIEFERIKK